MMVFGPGGNTRSISAVVAMSIFQKQAIMQQPLMGGVSFAAKQNKNVEKITVHTVIVAQDSEVFCEMRRLAQEILRNSDAGIHVDPDRPIRCLRLVGLADIM